MQRSLKIADVIARVRSSIEMGRYLDTRHATDRQAERQITRPEVLYVLRNGRHEKSKDQYQVRYDSWNYAIRGKTVDRRALRVIVSFDASDMLIITAIDLELRIRAD